MFKEFTLANANLIYQYIWTKDKMISHWRNTHGGVRSCHGNVCALAWQSWRAWQFQAMGVATGNSAARQKAICTIRRRSLRRKRRVKGGAYVYVLRSRHRRQEGFCEAAIRDHLSPNNYTLCTLVLLPCRQPMFLDVPFCLFHCSSIWPSQHLQTVVPKQPVLTSPTVCTTVCNHLPVLLYNSILLKRRGLIPGGLVEERQKKKKTEFAQITFTPLTLIWAGWSFCQTSKTLIINIF